jgi:EAL domain-containing protein (putative c-di-GMP-specific phosphodiesterase class I)
MTNKATLIYDRLQQEIDRMNKGVLLLVELLNKDELNVIIEDISSITNDFFTIVDKVCKKIDNTVIIKSNDELRFYLILPEGSKDAEQLAYLIYSQVQFYVNNDFPQSYLKCMVGSIKFDSGKENKANKIISYLLYGMSASKDYSYYYCYEDNPVNVKKLTQDNINLNLLKSTLLQKKAKFDYQPIIDRKTGNIEYYECLLRVQDKNNNFVSVGPMIQDAETKGIINIVDLSAIRMAIEELAKNSEIKLSVNISNIGVLDKRLLKRIESLLNKHDVAERLVIEITETTLNEDFATTKNFIGTFHAYGCKFALDDFGSGFTSFKQLINLPIDIIKIDGSYIRDILVNDSSRFFVEALINLAAELGIKTVAEYVENGEIAKFLIDIKVDGLQGNFFLPASGKRN